MIVLPKKIYLNGSDCFHLILEKSRDLSGEGNNQLYLCVQLHSDRAKQEIEENLKNSPLMDWIANVKLVNPQIGVPFYRYKSAGKKIEIGEHGIQEEQFPTKFLNAALSVKKNQFIKIDSYHFESNQFLLFTFHHILFDGKGAGMLLQHLTGKLDLPIDAYFPKRTKWKNPIKQWLNLIYVKKAVEKTNVGETAYLSERFNNKTGCSIYSHAFTEEETNQIKENAKVNGARFGLNFFQLACISKAFRLTLATSDELWVPIPYNGRKRGASGAVISNHTFFVFHRLKVEEQTELKTIVQQLQQQMNEQLKDELPEKYNRLMQLMRFFPTWFNHYVTTKSSKGKVASFLYSSTEVGEHENKEMIDRQWILPPFSYPPGFTVNFYTYRNQLNFHIVYANNSVNAEQVGVFTNELTRLLRAN